MKFLVDAQLPLALCDLIQSFGYDCVHTLQLANGNETTDADITAISLSEQRVVLSKDIDFFNSYMARLEPYKLVYVTTGNIENKALLNLFRLNLKELIEALKTASVIGINQYAITVVA
jgi:predicted nuclease of predicted toxin-antitoxin system